MTTITLITEFLSTIEAWIPPMGDAKHALLVDEGRLVLQVAIPELPLYYIEEKDLQYPFDTASWIKEDLNLNESA